MQKCKIYPIEFISFDGQSHSNGCGDGQLISEPSLYKKDAVKMIRELKIKKQENF